MSRELLDALAGAPRIARCEQNVWRRIWTPGFTFAFQGAARERRSPTVSAA